MTDLRSRNPRTGELQFDALHESSQRDVADAVEASREAWKSWSRVSAEDRAAALVAIADALDAQVQELAELADLETALGTPRLVGEVGRTTFQLRMFATELTAGQLLGAQVDEAIAGPPPAGRPRLHRRWVPLGPVAVFGAANFPFAFAECGGDTASALAAGCTVVVKEHPGHPVLAQKVIALVRDALSQMGHDPNVVVGVRGLSAGTALVAHDMITAVGFTGSEAGGRALFDVASARPHPIPFYGELGSINPVFISQAALEARADELAVEAAASVSLGLGQFCTKPSVIFVPAHDGFVDALGRELQKVEPGPLLGEYPRERFLASVNRVKSVTGVDERVAVNHVEGSALVGSGLLVVSMKDFLAHADALLEECFGPLALVVACETEDDFVQATTLLAGCLVATVHAQETSDQQLVATLVGALEHIAGRIVLNGWPTGVAVSAAQHHGGPYPASTAPLHTSVGLNAMMRFVRPVVLQNMSHEQWPSVV